ncbi:MAG: PQQ-dependent sugar dehydrogenase [Ignavibacteriales bacterium]|nr:PQQ-dependent sugar dehydrogenase [Ignavibacteriales bacterium]
MRRVICLICLVSLSLQVTWTQGPRGPQGEVGGTDQRLVERSNGLAGIKLERVFTNLSFNQPTFLTHAGDGSNRVFVTERRGVIHVFPNSPSVTAAQRKVFLDLSGRVESRVFGSGENGFFAMAFHPDFAQNRKFYVSYTDTMEGHIRTNKIGAMMSRVSELEVSQTNPDSADPGSERILLELEQPWDNHNGGQIAFGKDGYLYLSLGDGRAPNDTLKNGQNPMNWFGTVLRMDVDNQDPGLQYRVPPDNPYVGNTKGWKEEIYAYGLRNPWRFSFDRFSGTLWLADVGEKRAEEINIITSGGNYGWSIMEGLLCFRATSCDMTGLTLPVFEYTREGKGNTVTVTGGYVYRGSNPSLAALQGLYIYGDYGFKAIWGLEYANGVVKSNIQITTSTQGISSFGEDESGELYVVGYGGTNSQIFRFVEDNATDVRTPGSGVPTEFKLYPAYPNPFNPTTQISFDIPHTEHVTITIYNLLGIRVAQLTNRRYETGRHSVLWDGRDEGGGVAGSGTYLYSLEAGSYRRSGKMVLLR